MFVTNVFELSSKSFDPLPHHGYSLRIIHDILQTSPAVGEYLHPFADLQV